MTSRAKGKRAPPLGGFRHVLERAHSPHGSRKVGVAVPIATAPTNIHDARNIVSDTIDLEGNLHPSQTQRKCIARKIQIPPKGFRGPFTQ